MTTQVHTLIEIVDRRTGRVLYSQRVPSWRSSGEQRLLAEQQRRHVARVLGVPVRRLGIILTPPTPDPD